MKVISIVPWRYMHHLRHQEYHLVLAHLLDNENYRAQYQTMKDRYIILDNGAAEGECEDIETLYEKSQIIDADEIVLPDEFFDMDKTLKSTIHAHRFLRNKGFDGNTMVVPQGETLDEWIHCAMMFVSQNVGNIIGVPKNLAYLDKPDGRYKAIEKLLKYGEMPPLHLLGCWYDPNEVYKIYKSFGEFIRTVDSRMPYLYTMQNKILNPEYYKKPQTREMDIDAVVPDENKLKINIERWEGYCYGTL